jgi:hypothetical protein
LGVEVDFRLGAAALFGDQGGRREGKTQGGGRGRREGQRREGGGKGRGGKRVGGGKEERTYLHSRLGIDAGSNDALAWVMHKDRSVFKSFTDTTDLEK